MTITTPDSVQNEQGAAATRARVFSGVQPTGSLHLGNYLGAIRQWVARQAERENIFCIVDLHALTIPEDVDPRELRHLSRSVAAFYIAAGIDPEKSIVFVQSQVPEHTELAWLLTCATPLGWLYRMTQFKSKSEARESVGTGLLVYPTLMAADILLYDTDVVPVGDDQMQHVELTRDVAVRFNNLFGETFVVPRVEIPKAGARVMGLDDPDTKMSKSLSHRPGHALTLLADDRTLRKAVMSAVTDSGRELRFEHASRGVRNLLELYSILRGLGMDAVETEFEGQGYGTLKKALAEAVIDTIAPLRNRHAELMADAAELDNLLARGAERARAIAAPVVKRARDAMGVG